VAALGRRYEFGIALSPPFRCKKVIVSALPGIGILTTNCWARFINCAPTLLLIEKLTDLFEDVILPVSQDESIGRGFGIPALRLFI